METVIQKFGIWILVFISILIIIFIAGLFFGFPEWLFGQKYIDGKIIENNSYKGEYVKFLGAFIGGILVIVSLWISNMRVKEMNKQNMIAEKAQINTRFKDAAMLLASEKTSAMLSSIYALHQIAEEVSKETINNKYLSIVPEIFCAFMRENLVIERDEKGKIKDSNCKIPTIVFQTIIDVLLSNEKGKKNIYDLKKLNFSNLQLSQLNFKEIFDLRGVNFCEANLGMANLGGADLRGACFIDATFSTSLHEHYEPIIYGFPNGANLHGADLRGACLGGVILSFANLSNAKLQGVDLSMASLDGTVFSEAKLTGTRLGNSSLVYSNLSKADLNEANLNEANLNEANLSGATLVKTELSYAKLVNADLSGADLSEARLFATDLSGADLSEAKLTKAFLRRTNLKYANLSGTDLSGTDLSGADFSSADLNGADLHDAKLSDRSFGKPIINEETNLSGTIFENFSKVELKKIFVFKKKFQDNETKS